jgi:DNA repair protein RadC
MNNPELPLPSSELPANRLMESSPEYLTNSELLSLVLRGGSSVPARRLLRRYGSFKALSQTSPRELMDIPGIGRALACALSAALEIARRMESHCEAEKAKLEKPGDVAALLKGHFTGKTQEEFYVLLLDTKHHLLKTHRATIGLVDRSQVHAREVFRLAVRESSSRLLLVHNHPSGDPTPSAQDIACTRDLCAAGKIIGIEVLDHVIIGERTTQRAKYWLSFREENLL